MRSNVCQPEIGKTALAGAKHFTRASESQILLGDPEAIIGFPHDSDARAGGITQRGRIEQQASTLPIPSADAPP